MKLINSENLSPAAERIAAISMRQFAENGYDAASLNDIAIEAGIRKPSLYAHFASKDALYSVVFELALKAEGNCVDTYFAAPQDDNKLVGESYLVGLHHRFVEAPSLRFLLRAAFYPPTTLKTMVTTGFNDYLLDLRNHYSAALNKFYPENMPAASALNVEAYMAMVDSLHVDLIYGDHEAYLRRLNAVLQVLNIMYLSTAAAKNK